MESHKMNSRKIVLILIIILLGANVVAQDKTILFVLSAADTLPLNNGSKLRQTGVFLNEFYFLFRFSKLMKLLYTPGTYRTYSFNFFQVGLTGPEDSFSFFKML